MKAVSRPSPWRRTAAPRAGATRAGMTLIEIIVAMLILVGVILVLGNFSARFAQANGQARLVIAANRIAAQRLDTIQQMPTYASVDLLKEKGTKLTVDARPFTRNTSILRVGGGVLDTMDYKLVTVTVTQAAMQKTVSKTTAIAAY